jgi:hypothetical protein
MNNLIDDEQKCGLQRFVGISYTDLSTENVDKTICHHFLTI